MCELELKLEESRNLCTTLSNSIAQLKDGWRATIEQLEHFAAYVDGDESEGSASGAGAANGTMNGVNVYEDMAMRVRAIKDGSAKSFEDANK